MKEIQIPHQAGFLDGRIDHAPNPKALILLAHGAGAPMTHPFLHQLAQHLVEKGFSVLRFNFPYIQSGRKLPGNPKADIAAWQSVMEYAKSIVELPLLLSGKSYGGRMASHYLVTLQAEASGIIYFGFPLHAPNKPSASRADHLQQITIPQLFLQGTKDALANESLIREMASTLPLAKLVLIDGADHSFKVKGAKPGEIMERLVREVDNWNIRLNK